MWLVLNIFILCKISESYYVVKVDKTLRDLIWNFTRLPSSCFEIKKSFLGDLSLIALASFLRIIDNLLSISSSSSWTSSIYWINLLFFSKLSTNASVCSLLVSQFVFCNISFPVFKRYFISFLLLRHLKNEQCYMRLARFIALFNLIWYSILTSLYTISSHQCNALINKLRTKYFFISETVNHHTSPSRITIYCNTYETDDRWVNTYNWNCRWNTTSN